MRLIRQSRYRRQPWKNGGGETIEVAVFPPGASTENFDWRVSMARVENDGPFSAFASIDRTLTVLDGAGIALSLAGRETVEITDQPHSFPGDIATSARLLDGPITDLNVMTRRGVLQHRVSRFEFSSPREMIVRSPVALIYCQSGKLSVEDEIAPPLEVATGDSVLIESRPMDYRLSPEGPTTAILVEIGPA